MEYGTCIACKIYMKYIWTTYEIYTYTYGYTDTAIHCPILLHMKHMSQKYKYWVWGYVTSTHVNFLANDII